MTLVHGNSDVKFSVIKDSCQWDQSIPPHKWLLIPNMGIPQVTKVPRDVPPSDSHAQKCMSSWNVSTIVQFQPKFQCINKF
jgi:hypothetical protein